MRVEGFSIEHSIHIYPPYISRLKNSCGEYYAWVPFNTKLRKGKRPVYINISMNLDYEESPFFLRDSRASETLARENHPMRGKAPFSRGVIFTRARVSLLYYP